MKWFLTCVVFLFAVSAANAGWYERTYNEKYQIKVYPAPVLERCDHGSLHEVQPAPYWEERTRTVRQRYWVDEPVTYVVPAPVYVYPAPVYVIPAPVYVYPTYPACPPIYYQW